MNKAQYNTQDLYPDMYKLHEDNDSLAETRKVDNECLEKKEDGVSYDEMLENTRYSRYVAEDQFVEDSKRFPSEISLPRYLNKQVCMK